MFCLLCITVKVVRPTKQLQLKVVASEGLAKHLYEVG